jgi:hypothetical protein
MSVMMAPKSLPLWGRWQPRQRLTVGAVPEHVPPPTRLRRATSPKWGDSKKGAN